MNVPFRHTRIVTAIAGLAFAAAAGQASAAAFALAEQNVMGLGNAFAGAGATAEDANTLWFNPAGLARLNLPQVEFALHTVTPSAKLNDQGSQPALGQPLGGNGGDAGATAVLPNLYGSFALSPEWHFGIGINAPFGLKTEYGDGWLGRYQALKSEIKTVNINPSVGWRATKDFWLGAGVSYQKFEATLTNNVNYSAALAQVYRNPALQIPPSVVNSLIAATSGLDSFVSNKGDDWSWGWNIGAMYSYNGDANNDPGAGRIGLAYRSKIKHNVTGTVDFHNPTVPTLTGGLAPLNGAVQAASGAINQTLSDGGIMLDVELPDTASLSYYHKLNDKWDVLADVTWTGWSSIQQLAINRTSGTTLGVLPENFKDTWRYAAGVNYNYSERLVLRAGVAFDQSPVNDVDRSPRLPDGDRTWLALGARYKYTSAINFDVGAVYIWVKDPSIHTSENPQAVAANGLIKGNYTSNTVVLSAQMNYRFR
jgi:long-chain fatty acid transport protein